MIGGFLYTFLYGWFTFGCSKVGWFQKLKKLKTKNRIEKIYIYLYIIYVLPIKAIGPLTGSLQSNRKRVFCDGTHKQDKQTDGQTDITTSRLHRPRGQFSNKNV